MAQSGRFAALRARCACALAFCAALLQCSIFAPGDAETPAYYGGPPATVLEVAADLLRKQGYQVSEVDSTFLEVQGEKEEVASRTDGSLIRGTLVSQQVVVDADPEGEQTRLQALFTVTWRRPTGERRTWVPESAVSLRLRSRFFTDLHRELGDTVSGQ